MDLSVIVPCHNLEKFIKPLLDSLKLQQFTYEVELIFVCDYCIDRTHEIIEEEMVDTQYPISIYDVDVRSCGLARNKGMKYATGTYIWFMDGDDWLIDNSAIQKVLNTMKYYPHEILALEYNAPGFGFKGHLYFCLRRSTMAFFMMDWISEGLNKALLTEFALVTQNFPSLGM